MHAGTSGEPTNIAKEEASFVDCYVGVRAQRHHESYVLRILGVLALLMVLSIFVFLIEVDAFGQRRALYIHF
eukprot:SAG31_NODE_2340_length_5920_cov_4.296561_1_plen_72_part_00